MSDVLIKGMELPKGNDYLHLIIQNGKVHKAISCGYISTDELNVANAVELPPHGELVERDKISSLALEIAEATQQPTEETIFTALREVPVILEATE